MSQTIAIELEVPEDLQRFCFPAALNNRLQELLHRQDQGVALTKAERKEADGLVQMAELLALLRLRAERAHQKGTPQV